jgi:hypothetical protein
MLMRRHSTFLRVFKIASLHGRMQSLTSGNLVNRTSDRRRFDLRRLGKRLSWFRPTSSQF